MLIQREPISLLLSACWEVTLTVSLLHSGRNRTPSRSVFLFKVNCVPIDFGGTPLFDMDAESADLMRAVDSHSDRRAPSTVELLCPMHPGLGEGHDFESTCPACQMIQWGSTSNFTKLSVSSSCVLREGPSAGDECPIVC